MHRVNGPPLLNEENAISRLSNGSSYPQEDGSGKRIKLSISIINLTISRPFSRFSRHVVPVGSSFLCGPEIPGSLRIAICSSDDG
jgi:hypothetical protein